MCIRYKFFSPLCFTKNSEDNKLDFIVYCGLAYLSKYWRQGPRNLWHSLPQTGWECFLPLLCVVNLFHSLCWAALLKQWLILKGMSFYGEHLMALELSKKKKDGWMDDSQIITRRITWCGKKTTLFSMHCIVYFPLIILSYSIFFHDYMMHVFFFKKRKKKC